MLAVLQALAVFTTSSPAQTQEQAATAVVEAMVGRVARGAVNRTWIESSFWLPDDTELGSGAHSRRVDRLMLELGPGSPLRQALEHRPAVVGAVRGPDYIRVVLAGDRPLTVRVRSDEQGWRIEDFSPSSCSMCPEPERFVRDLVEAGGRWRLTPGAELDVEGLRETEPERISAWLSALHARNVAAGYVRWLLAETRVLSSDGATVMVSVRGHEEPWSVVYEEQRWMVDYTALAADSPLRLADEDLKRWTQATEVRKARAEWWLPEWREVDGAMRVSNELLFAAPRTAQADVIVYAHDIGRRYAMIARLDPDTGDVLFARPAPRLPRSSSQPVAGWRAGFYFSLSADGRKLAVAGGDRLWVFSGDTGEELGRLQQIVGVSGVAWSGDGRRLALAEGRGTVRVLNDRLETVARLPGSGSPVVGLAWRHGQLFVLAADGELALLAGEDLKRRESWTACCGAATGLEWDADRDEALVTCHSTCSPAWSWRVSPALASPGEQLGDDLLSAPNGAVALDPSGRWLVAPYAGADGAAALVDRRDASIAAAFGDMPLVRVYWQANGQAFWATDLGGQTWRYQVKELIDGPLRTRTVGPRLQLHSDA